MRTRTGHRGAALAVFALISLTYGAGLTTGYAPPLHHHIFTDTTCGWVFIGTGIFAATGIPIRCNALHFAACELVATAWAILLSTHWTQPHGWASGISWIGIALTMLVISSWPEPVTLIDPTQLNNKGE